MSEYLCPEWKVWNKQTRSNQLFVSFVTELHSDKHLYSEEPEHLISVWGGHISVASGFVLMDMNLNSVHWYNK